MSSRLALNATATIEAATLRPLSVALGAISSATEASPGRTQRKFRYIRWVSHLKLTQHFTRTTKNAKYRSSHYPDGNSVARTALGSKFETFDFGTGYSSLAYLKQLPLDMLKIDRSFVLDLLTHQNDAVIAHTTIALERRPGLRVRAEYVETVAQRDFLLEHGCDAYQGYLCARTLPADAAVSVI